MATATGWERENRAHFDEIAADYDKARWEYPAQLFRDIFEYSGAGARAVEIGAGTGKATAPFLDAGYAVTAVEMGANMAKFLESKFRGRRGLAIVNDTFENASLEDGAYDLAYAASAFHWVDAEIGCPKVHRLLKSGGAFALFRNNLVPSDGEDLYEEIQICYARHYNTHYTSSKRPARKSERDFREPAGIYQGFRFEGMEMHGFRDVRMKFYDAALTYGADEYIALLDTHSDHRSLPEANRAGLYSGVRDAIARHGGKLTMKCVFQLYMGKKSTPP